MMPSKTSAVTASLNVTWNLPSKMVETGNPRKVVPKFPLTMSRR